MKLKAFLRRFQVIIAMDLLLALSNIFKVMVPMLVLAFSLSCLISGIRGGQMNLTWQE